LDPWHYGLYYTKNGFYQPASCIIKNKSTCKYSVDLLNDYVMGDFI
jgi:hypothetical protein